MSLTDWAQIKKDAKQFEDEHPEVVAEPPMCANGCGRQTGNVYHMYCSDRCGFEHQGFI